MIKSFEAPRCESCHTYRHCLVSRLSNEEKTDFRQIIGYQAKVKKGQHLAVQGVADSEIYLIRCGGFKTSLLTEDGLEQVTGFRMAGEIVGLEGLFKAKQPSSAVALEDSEVCAISAPHVTTLGGKWIIFHQRLIEMLQQEIGELNHLLVTRNKKNSSQRLIGFLLNQSKKNEEMGLSGRHLRLKMSRTEMGNYLGLKIETVSRKLTQLSLQGLIQIDRRVIQIQNIQALSASQASFISED